MILKFFIFIACSFTIVNAVNIKCDPNKSNATFCTVIPFTITSDKDEANFIGSLENINNFVVKNSNSRYLPLNLPNIETLIYEESELEEIQENALKFLTELSEVSFHRNKLTIITNVTFIANTAIKKLSLSSNNIEIIESAAFSELRKLEEINLSDNNISELSAAIFENNVEIKILNLEDNCIKNIPIVIFNTLKNLAHVNLNDNEIGELPGRLFYHNENLKSFTVNRNKLKFIGIEILPIINNLDHHDFLKNICTEKLDRQYDKQELKKVIKSDCTPQCEKEKSWLSNELTANERVKRETVSVDEILNEVEKRELFVKKNDFEAKFDDKFEIISKEIGKLMTVVSALNEKLQTEAESIQNTIKLINNQANEPKEIKKITAAVKNINDVINNIESKIDEIQQNTVHTESKISDKISTLIDEKLSLINEKIDDKTEEIKNSVENLKTKPNEDNQVRNLIDEKASELSKEIESLKTTFTNDNQKLYSLTSNLQNNMASIINDILEIKQDILHIGTQESLNNNNND